jgi:hypothetical protein
MNFWTNLIDISLAPIILSCSDAILLFMLCGGNQETIRKIRFWKLKFFLILVGMVVTECIFNGGTGQDADIYIFYVIRYIFLFLFATLCTNMPRNASIYLSILVLLFTDIALITFVRVSLILFSIDYLVSGLFLYRLVAHTVLLIIKIGLTLLIKNQTRSQIYGIESPYQAVIIMLPALPFFYMRDYTHILSIRPADIPWSIHFLTVLCGICALINMIVSENLSFQIRQNEKLHMENIIRKQNDHYEATVNTFEAVNRKYHDLRHIFRGIDTMDNIQDVKNYIHSIENEIRDYDLICHSGNKTLDVILSDRMRECKRKGIQFHVHADGQGWDIVQDADIATIFGNALDNAIESTESIRDESLRLINVRVGRVNNMLIARFENQFTHVLEKKQSQYLSTKRDKVNHGYGLQSIELMIRKYGGELDITTDKGPFILTVIIPAT